jgi:hypothetical protein|tara:strand:+ start:508 stop:777 length:270 start_codon:yes stop_codon:yes gene_type:complete
VDEIFGNTIPTPGFNSDPVNPPHYKHGTFEVIDILQDQLTPVEFRGMLRGNILKYLLRYPFKGGVTDLEKAQWYLDRLVKLENDQAPTK